MNHIGYLLIYRNSKTIDFDTLWPSINTDDQIPGAMRKI